MAWGFTRLQGSGSRLRPWHYVYCFHITALLLWNTQFRFPWVKQSKTDPFRRGVPLYVGRTGVNLCPVAVMLSYLELRGGKPGPLFLFQNMKPLARPHFVDAVRDALEKLRRSTPVTVSELELPPQWQPTAWKIALLKPLVSGRVWHICSISVVPESAMWVFLACWQSSEVIQTQATMMLIVGWDCVKMMFPAFVMWCNIRAWGGRLWEPAWAGLEALLQAPSLKPLYSPGTLEESTEGQGSRSHTFAIQPGPGLWC